MLARNSESKFTVTCESEDKTEPVAMWQHIMYAKRLDREGIAYGTTSETTCTRGANVNVRPKCPPNTKCSDETCTTCVPI